MAFSQTLHLTLHELHTSLPRILLALSRRRLRIGCMDYRLCAGPDGATAGGGTATLALELDCTGAEARALAAQLGRMLEVVSVELDTAERQDTAG